MEGPENKPQKRKPKRLPVVPPWDEVQALLKATTTQRDRLILMVAVYMGLRNFEICGLTVQDVNWRAGELFIRGKGDKDAVLPIPDILRGPLRGWIGSRRTGPLFRSRKASGHLTPRALRQLVKRVAEAAKLPDASKGRKYYPHVLRHFFCTDKIRKGVPLPYVQRLMRHSEIKTTLRYTSVAPEDLRKGMNA